SMLRSVCLTISIDIQIVIITFFFFSSRRRHTRCYRDWSSDVCSSDLATIQNFKKLGIDATYVKQVEGVSSGVAPIFVESSGQNRSEERRVGKECRARWMTDA